MNFQKIKLLPKHCFHCFRYLIIFPTSVIFLNGHGIIKFLYLIIGKHTFSYMENFTQHAKNQFYHNPIFVTPCFSHDIALCLRQQRFDTLKGVINIDTYALKISRDTVLKLQKLGPYFTHSIIHKATQYL